MWERGELKERAKRCLRVYYWQAFLVSVLAAFLGGADISVGGSVSRYTKEIQATLSRFSPAMLKLILTVLLVIIILALIYTIFVGNVIRVGRSRYFMESRAYGQGCGVGRLFWGFGEGRYWNIVKTMFLMDLRVLLLSLLLLVPGIIAAYRYYMVSYILSENPQMDTGDVLSLSAEMMKGNKMNTFVLELSFLGWALGLSVLWVFLGSILYLVLGMATFPIAVFYSKLIVPYMEATFAELYGYLRRPYLSPSNGSRQLAGFGVELSEDSTFLEDVSGGETQGYDQWYRS